jgi:hypothetical protein
VHLLVKKTLIFIEMHGTTTKIISRRITILVRIGQQLYAKTFEECRFIYGLLTNVILIFLVSMVTMVTAATNFNKVPVIITQWFLYYHHVSDPPPSNSVHRIYLRAYMISLYIADWFL